MQRNARRLADRIFEAMHSSGKVDRGAFHNVEQRLRRSRLPESAGGAFRLPFSASLLTSTWKIQIDTGGTFTDCLATSPEGEVRRTKVLSSSALRGRVLGREGPRRLRIGESWGVPRDFVVGFRFQYLSGEPSEVVEIVEYDPAGTLELSAEVEARNGSAFEAISPDEAPVLAARVVIGVGAGAPLLPIEMRLATTRGTNALLERCGGRTAFFVTVGFGDLLRIGDQSRPALFVLNIRKPEPLYETFIEVQERLSAEGDVLRPLDTSRLANDARRLVSEGFQAAAVALAHSYLNPIHEREVAAVLRRAGFRYISLSSELAPLIKLLPRAETAVVDAYLSPVVRDYVSRVRDELSRDNEGGSLLLMTSSGGLVGPEQFMAKDSLLSGPVGGVLGAVRSGRDAGFDRVIAFDMGGTSADVALFPGELDFALEHQVGDARLASPAVAIESVAAGGGSICHFTDGRLQVGPESAGAVPGPACYGAGGPLTLTDVHLLLGRLAPESFSIPILPEASELALQAVLERLEDETGEIVDRTSLLDGLLQIANERMAEAIATVSIRKGYDPAEFALVSFGGAGGLHACSIADRLEIKTVLIPEDAGLLSAVGLSCARIERIRQRSVLRLLSEVAASLEREFAELGEEAKAAVAAEGIPGDQIELTRRVLQLRALGQDSSIEVNFTSVVSLETMFEARYRTLFGYSPARRPIEVVSLLCAAASAAPDPTVPVSIADASQSRSVLNPPRESTSEGLYVTCWFQGAWRETPAFDRSELPSDFVREGPAVFYGAHSAAVAAPDWTVRMGSAGALVFERSGATAVEPSAGLKPTSEAVRLELFTHRFAGIARNMGEMLRRAALSTNIKERLDFSCALLDADGNLVVNAPHIPVHLGALGLCVRSVRDRLPLRPGDVVVTNHPAFGGSHLPDMTVITPVFNCAPAGADTGSSESTEAELPELIGYVASRAHHADIGGIHPGSMPPSATRLSEEGVVIPPMYLVEEYDPRWDQLRDLLVSGPFPCRAVEENLADLRATVAANHAGATALVDLCRSEGNSTVHHYMAALQNVAADRARRALSSVPEGEHHAVEFLDDGARLEVYVRITKGEAEVDFSGSSGVHPGNLNATPAIVRSVLLYWVRLLVDAPLPLNEGLMRPIRLLLPEGILNPLFPENPSDAPAVVGGNVETSQRLVDTLLKALGIVACSQGTMNNVLFGNEQFGYYETVCGGAGAGPDFDGASAIHTHMTNTRITDPEILEHRYPVRLERFCIRQGSGGRGEWSGGDGAVRELTFLAPVRLSLLTQHRSSGPCGAKGGQPGAPGWQRVFRASGEVVVLGSVDGCEIRPGDRLLLETPGGGGFGPAPAGQRPAIAKKQ